MVREEKGMSRGLQNVELYSLFLELNSLCFDDWLPKTLIVSSSKRLKRRAGACYFYEYPNGVIKPLEICLSEIYIKKYPDEIESILLHEMIHMKLGHIRHNQEFHNYIDYLYVTFGKEVKVIGKSMKYFYQCDNCSKLYILDEDISPLLYRCKECYGTLRDLKN